MCDITGLEASTIGIINPFRYKGYYYDEETKLYHLTSRYYDPEVGRFITPDDVDYLDPTNINGLNLYTYCGNDPVNYKQTSVSSGYSITNSVLSETMCTCFKSSINQSNEEVSVFNSILANGSFRSGLLFGKGSLTRLYASRHTRSQINLKNGKFVLGAFEKFSLLNATGQIGVGNDEVSVSIVGVGDIGAISGMVGIIVNPNENIYFAGIEAKAAVFTARGGIQFEIFNNQIEVGASVNALSAGFQLGIGIKNGEIYFTSGIALLFGYDFYIRIKFA